MKAFRSRRRVACKFLRLVADTAAATAKCYPSKIVSLVVFLKKTLPGRVSRCRTAFQELKLQDWLLYSGAVPRHDRKGWI
jgi:hypothetical protein